MAVATVRRFRQTTIIACGASSRTQRNLTRGQHSG
jgi:hypothetical protein